MVFGDPIIWKLAKMQELYSHYYLCTPSVKASLFFSIDSQGNESTAMESSWTELYIFSLEVWCGVKHQATLSHHNKQFNEDHELQ